MTNSNMISLFVVLLILFKIYDVYSKKNLTTKQRTQLNEINEAHASPWWRWVIHFSLILYLLLLFRYSSYFTSQLLLAVALGAGVLALLIYHFFTDIYDLKRSFARRKQLKTANLPTSNISLLSIAAMMLFLIAIFIMTYWKQFHS